MSSEVKTATDVSRHNHPMTRATAKSVIALLFVFLAAPLFAQDGFFSGWFARVDKAESEQPHWASPLVTTTPRLTERVRYEQLWQTNSKGITTNNYDGGKGVNFIPFDRVEVSFYAPPYLVHNDPASRDGFGDVAFMVKYRLLAADEQKGNYILSAFLGWSLPTGSYKNGKPDAVITPTLGYGKGFGNFDMQGTFGVAMPTADTNLIGRNYTWNNAFQYRLFKKLWPEVELNSTFIQDGPNGGKKQTFVTPGFKIGRIPLGGRFSLNFGGAFQIAATHYHTTNHNGILSVSMPF
jgi:Putative MetA-pathway of phenol degradation